MRNVNAIVNHLNHATVVDTINYTYGDSAWSDKLTAYDGQTITYDAIGNPTSYKGATLTWQGRLLVSYAKNGERYEYTYDADGLRTSKKKYVNNVLSFTENYVWVNDKIVAVKRVNSNNTSITVRYLYDADDELFGFVYNNKTYFYIKNPRGDIGGIINADDEIAYYAMDYDAWGNVTYTLAEGLTTAQEAEALHIQEINNFTYRGYFYDSETNLYYLQSRYYDPGIGRFINADDNKYVAYSGNPKSFNIFTYCENNPVNSIDLTGFSSVKDLNNIMTSFINGKKSVLKTFVKLLIKNGKGFYTAFHELAQVLIANKLSSVYHYSVELEYLCSDGKHEIDVYGYKTIAKRLYRYMWEVKPLGTSPEKQLALYSSLEPKIKRGFHINEFNTTICKGLMMKISFNNSGGAFYSFYNNKGKRITNAELRKIIINGVKTLAGIGVAVAVVAAIVSIFSGGTASPAVIAAAEPALIYAFPIIIQKAA